jgi:hypothetical protein
MTKACVSILLIAITGFALAQSQPDVGLTLESSRFTSNRTSVLRVQVDIPSGYYIPAETTDTFKGAWLQLVEPGFDVRQLPTYPVPELTGPVGAAANALAYKGTITILVPVKVAAVAGTRTLTFQFGFQLCDSIDCSQFATKTVRQSVRVDEPVEPAESLAFRIDSSRVGIVLERRITVPRNAGELNGRPLARFAVQLLAVPNADRAQLQGEAGPGSQWAIASNGRTYRALVEEPAAFAAGCGDPTSSETRLTLVARVTGTSFEQEPAKYFLASRGDSADGASGSLASASINLNLTDSQRRELEELIGRQLRITLPSLFAPDPRIPVASQPKESAYDRRVRQGQGRLAYHMEAFRAAPDGDARLFVRAYWVIGPRAQTGLTLWIRFDGKSFSVESSDAGVSRFARYIEAKGMGLDIAARPEYAGTLLNVIPARDGWAHVIMGRRGYESVEVSVWKYSPVGPQDTGLQYLYGC